MKRRNNLGGQPLTKKEEQLVHQPKTAEALYDDILSGRLRRFPKGTFDDISVGKRLTVYLVEKILTNPRGTYKWKKEEIPKKTNFKIFAENKLVGMINTFYHTSPSAVIMAAYKTLPWHSKEVKLKPYYFAQAPRNTWINTDGSKNFEVARQATKELINILMAEKEWRFGDIPKRIRKEHFEENLLPFEANLSSALQLVYDGSPVQMIMDAYEKLPWQNKEIKLRPYYFSKAPQNLWVLENGVKNYGLARQATRELIDILMAEHDWRLEDVPSQITCNHFEENNLPFEANLGGMLQQVYNDSPSDAIIDTYSILPFERKTIGLRPYHFKCIRNIWTSKNGVKNYELAREATRAFVHEFMKREKCSLDEALKNIFRSTFREPLLPFGNNLGGMLNSVYNNSSTAAIKDAFNE